MKKPLLSTFILCFLSTVLSLCAIALLEAHIAYASPYVDIDVAAAHSMITNSGYPNLVVLDVRRQDEYDGGHIRGAVLIPHTELEVRIDELTGHENHEIIVYCRTGRRSVAASEIIDSHNFTRVYNMLGGISAWQNAGYSVWSPEEVVPFWMRWWFWATVATVIVVLAGVVYFLKKMKPLPPAAPPPTSEAAL